MRPEEVQPIRSGSEIKYHMTQKRYDEESTLAQEIPIIVKNKVRTQGFFGGSKL